MSTPNSTPVRLTYVGRCRTSDNKVGQEFATSDGGRVVYGKTKARAIGHVYLVDAVLDERGHPQSVFPSTLTFTPEKHHDAEEVAAWQAADAAFGMFEERRKAEARAAKNPDLDEALAPVLALVRRARTLNEADAIAALVSQRVRRAWWER